MLLHPREGEKGRLNSIVPITVRPGSEDSGRGVYIAMLISGLGSQVQELRSLELEYRGWVQDHYLVNVIHTFSP